MKITENTTQEEINDEAMDILMTDLKFPHSVAECVVNYLAAANIIVNGKN